MKFDAEQIWQIEHGEYSGVNVYIHKVVSHDVIEKSFHISVPSEGVSHMPFSGNALEQSNLKFVEARQNLGSDWMMG